MAKGLCVDGVPVDKKVRSFQLTRNPNDFLMIQQYYDDYKEHWHKKVEDLIDMEEFEREWYHKLLHSIETYHEDKAIMICRVKGWSLNHKFNRWFYSALRNWICNIKTQAFRIKKRPGIVCPICLREVSRIEERHLAHIRTTKDLPKIFQWENETYRTCLKPRKQVRRYVCTYKEAKKDPRQKTVPVNWLWKLPFGEPGVVCPFTKKIISILDDEYLLLLPKKYKHYAKPYTWFEFQEEFPSYLIYSELMSLDFSETTTSNKNRVFADQVGSNYRLLKADFPSYTCEYNYLGKGRSSPAEYEYAVLAVENCVENKTDREILRYMMIGYDAKDICEELAISRNEFKSRIVELRSNKNLEKTLLTGIIE